MKISWRFGADYVDKYPNFIELNRDETFEGRTICQHIVYLIRDTPATGVCVDDKIIWKTGRDNVADAEFCAIRALMPPPREATRVMLIDYTIQECSDDECKACGIVNSHEADCKVVSNGWCFDPGDEDDGSEAYCG